jgi:hypothetical protein
MRLSAQTILLFLVSVALVATGLIGWFRPAALPADVADAKFWFVFAGWAVLALATLLRS